MQILTKTETVATLVQDTSLSKREIEGILARLEDIWTEALVRGDQVQLPGIGRLTPKLKDARTARNPVNGEPVDVPAKLAVKFQASAPLKQKLVR
jgi:DNA-binding protein HU-beta